LGRQDGALHWVPGIARRSRLRPTGGWGGGKTMQTVDVAVIGGGPGGSTCAGLLKKYQPDLSVAVFEREQFPRDHIGESQLPMISRILNELGCWDQVEAANFPIKIGATYRWGNSEKLWDFEFMPMKNYREEPRPRPWSHQARQLAFQVDRAVYDKILLDHAADLGAQVSQGVGVKHVHHEGDRITSLELADGRQVSARHYVDASGGSSIVRRRLGVEVDIPTSLQNIAFWDYWEKAEWATRYPGGATRVLVLSIGCGWIWFIPLSDTRTSIGFVCPRGYYSNQKKTPRELYDWALSQEPLIEQLTAGASRRGEVQATRDWSFVADRVVGENWFLVGEAAGFADPILAAGMTLTQTSAREAAYTILELERGKHRAEWLRKTYDDNQRTRIRQHIRFADFWYSSNGVFTDLQEYTSKIARDAGLDLSPEMAFQWLGTGGFTHDSVGQVGLGGLDLAGARQIAGRFLDQEAGWNLAQFNRFKLEVKGADLESIPTFNHGRIKAVSCYKRNGTRLPVTGLFAVIIEILRKGDDINNVVSRMKHAAASMREQMVPDLAFAQLIQALELMLSDGWVKGAFDPALGRLQLSSPREGDNIHSNSDLDQRLQRLEQ
jgi:flavin-dependent dehydrogenase